MVLSSGEILSIGSGIQSQVGGAAAIRHSAHKPNEEKTAEIPKCKIKYHKIRKYEKYRIKGNISEPRAGNGNIIIGLRSKGVQGVITALELREEERDTLVKVSDKVIIDDFLRWEADKDYDFIIGNPPYSLAREFIEKCFEIANKNTVIIMLLRTAFLESKSRYEFWQQYPLSGLYTLSKRPSFTGKGFDATSYSWFIWDNRTDKQEIKVI